LVLAIGVRDNTERVFYHAELPQNRQVAKQDTGERNAIEGKFGEGKRKYGLGCIRARLAKTSESVITLQLLVMNLERRLRVLFCLIFTLLSRSRLAMSFG